MNAVVSKDTNSPHQMIEPTIIAIVKADRSRWFILSLSLVISVIIAISFAWNYANLANNNKEIIYVKLYPDGSWENVEYNSQDKQLYFKTTVDSILAKYVENRYGLNPITVTRDFGEASLIMDSKLQHEFLSQDGFNAAQKANDVKNEPLHNIDIDWEFNDHYDQIEGFSNGLNTDVVRTNIYFTRTEKTKNGDKEPEKLMLRIQWLLMPKSTLEKQNKEFIKVNPIGLKIISEKLVKAGN